MRSPSWHLTIQTISVLVIIASLTWLVYEPGFEPLITLLGAFAGILVSREHSSIDLERKKRLRQVMLQKVRATWIHGLLDNSLHGAGRLELGLEYNPNFVARPWAIFSEQLHQPSQSLPSKIQALELCQKLGGSMLILGEPGSGKTITLLELARDLLDIAESDKSQPIPIVFNLASWGYKRQTLAKWLVEELQIIYQINKKYSQVWLEEEPFFLLLDGLDEVKAEFRSNCVEAINQFRYKYNLTHVVVCSRTADYERLTTKLHLPGAAIIQPLTLEQADAYLEAAGKQLESARAAIRTEVTLQELARIPLNLSIIAQAYRGLTLEGLRPGTQKTQRQHLYDTYVRRIFERHHMKLPYTKHNTLKWLSWLAKQMRLHEQSVFHLERLQPSWLQTKTQQRLYSWTVTIMFMLTYAILGWLMYWLPGIVFGLGLGLYASIKDKPSTHKIELAEKLRWRIRGPIKELWPIFKIMLPIWLIMPVIFWLISLLIPLFHTGSLTLVDSYLFVSMFYVASFIFLIINGSAKYSEPASRTIPNLGIKLSIRNAFWTGAITTALVGIVTSSVLITIFGRDIGFSKRMIAVGLLGIRLALAYGLITALWQGGYTGVKHYCLRFALYCGGSTPLDFVRFLDYSVNRLLMRRVGGGYAFIHDTFLGYFAELETRQ